MQINTFPSNVHSLACYALNQSSLDERRKKYEQAVNRWNKVKAQGCEEAFCAEYSGISRATYYRYKKILSSLSHLVLPSKRPKHVRKPRWGDTEEGLVLRLRRENPTYGKHKITVLLKRDHGVNLSESTVGRILRQLMDRGLAPKSISCSRVKRRRSFTKGHAKPWSFKKYTSMRLGERVQIDHMTVTKNQTTLKHFQAWERKSKWIHAQVYRNAKATTAKKFLEDVVQQSPFPILSIQVDGGSEFMAEFEQACQELNIPLYVLPPAKPKYNGGVERGNRIFREEFYALPTLLADSVGAFKAELKKALQKYNTYRPHFNLKGQTPMQYIKLNLPEAVA